MQHLRIPKALYDKTAGGNKYQYNGHIAQQAGDYYTEDVGGSETETWIMDTCCGQWHVLNTGVGVASPTQT